MQYDWIVGELRKQCEEMDCGNCNTCVKLKAADAIEDMGNKMKLYTFLWNHIPKGELDIILDLYREQKEGRGQE